MINVARNESGTEESSLAMGLSETLGRIVRDEGFNLEFSEAKEHIFTEVISTLKEGDDSDEDEEDGDGGDSPSPGCTEDFTNEEVKQEMV